MTRAELAFSIAQERHPGRDNTFLVEVASEIVDDWEFNDEREAAEGLELMCGVA